MIWFNNSNRGGIGRYNPKTGEFKEWQSPSGPRSHPYGIVLLDVATVQLTADSASTDVTALAARLDRLERQVAEGVVAVEINNGKLQIDIGPGN